VLVDLLAELLVSLLQLPLAPAPANSPACSPPPMGRVMLWITAASILSGLALVLMLASAAGSMTGWIT